MFVSLVKTNKSTTTEQKTVRMTRRKVPVQHNTIYSFSIMFVTKMKSYTVMFMFL